MTNNMTNKTQIAAQKINEMTKDGKYLMIFLMTFGSCKNLELKDEETIDSMIDFLTKKGY